MWAMRLFMASFFSYCWDIGYGTQKPCKGQGRDGCKISLSGLGQVGFNHQELILIRVLSFVPSTMLMRYTARPLNALHRDHVNSRPDVRLAYAITSSLLLTPAMAVCWLLGLFVGGIAFLAAMAVCWLLIKGGGSDF